MRVLCVFVAFAAAVGALPVPAASEDNPMDEIERWVSSAGDLADGIWDLYSEISKD